MIPTTLAEAEALDAADPLARFRARFRLPEGLIYLNGNSLGPLTADAEARIADVVAREWGSGLVRSWGGAQWIDAPERIGAKLARLLGVAPNEILAPGPPTSVCLYQLIVAVGALGDGPILAEDDNFPTDAYVADEAARLLGRPFRMVPGAEIAGALEAGTLAIVTQVNYRTGAKADMAALEARARQVGATILWDLSHSAGAVPIDLARDGAVLAVGCGYKFLNGGPGAPAYLYVARALQEGLRNPIAGWWGHVAPFAFEPGYRPARAIDRFQAGTPPMLSLLALEAGMAPLLEADPHALAGKSAALFDLFAARAPEALHLVTPREAAARGSQIAFAHPHAFEIMQALIDAQVIGDFRAPDIARFGLTPLYTRHADIWRATEILREILRDETWRDPRFAVKGRVT